MIALALIAALSVTPAVGKTLDRPVEPIFQPAALRTVEPAPAPALQSVAVTLECTAHADGKVDGCRVLEETHPGMGFGAAAIALMDGAEVEPGDRDVQFARTIQFMP